MIQRVQSLYLLTVTIISSFLLYYSTLFDYPFFIKKFEVFFWTPITSMTCIFFFRKRSVQNFICFLLILVQLFLIIFFIYCNHLSINKFMYSVIGVSILNTLLIFLARRSIKKDEDLIRSIDRIR